MTCKHPLWGCDPDECLCVCAICADRRTPYRREKYKRERNYQQGRRMFEGWLASLTVENRGVVEDWYSIMQDRLIADVQESTQ